MFKNIVAFAVMAQAVKIEYVDSDLFSDDREAIAQSLSSIKQSEQDVKGTFHTLS